MQGLKRLTEKHIEVVCRPKDQSVVKDAIKKAESESGVNIPGRKVEVSSRDKLPDDRYTIRWLPLSLHDISRLEILIFLILQCWWRQNHCLGRPHCCGQYLREVAYHWLAHEP